MTALDHNLDVAQSLRAHLKATVPDADLRVWRVTSHGISIHVGPEVGIWSDFEIRPELQRVALAVDPMCRWAHTNMATYFTYRWDCVFDGVKVSVKGEGKGDPGVRPAPLPLPKAVAEVAA